MDSNGTKLDFKKRYQLTLYSSRYTSKVSPIIIEFTQEQDIYEEEIFLSYFATFECYILDNDYEAETRAILYCDTFNQKIYLTFTEDDEKVNLVIKKCIPEDYKEEEEEMTMGDIWQKY